MPPADLERVQHMLYYAGWAMRHAEGHTRQSLESDEVLTLALTRALEIVGEAASQTAQDFRGKGLHETSWMNVDERRGLTASRRFCLRSTGCPVDKHSSSRACRG